MSSNPTFDPKDAQALESQGLMTAPRQGYRLVDKRKLNRSSDSDDTEGLSSIFPAISVPSPPTSDPEDAPHAQVPEKLESVEYLETIGFQRRKAEEIFDSFQRFNDPVFDRPELLDFALTPITESVRPDALDDSDDWRGCARALGVCDELIDAILDPKYDAIRRTETLRYWIADSMTARHGALQEVQLTSAERQGRRNRGVKKPRLASGSGPVGAPAPEIAMTAAYRPNAPGMLFLWKGIAKHRCDNLLTDSGRIKTLQEIQTAPGGDFNGRSLGTYWAVNKAVAVLYCAYLKRRNIPPADICLIELRVPNSTIESLKRTIAQFPSSDFKELVWRSRRKEYLPKNLSHINKACMIGHIVKSHSKDITKMNSPEEIQFQNMMKLKPGHKYPIEPQQSTASTNEGQQLVTQYFFGTQEAEDLLEQTATAIIHTVPWKEFRDVIKECDIELE